MERLVSEVTIMYVEWDLNIYLLTHLNHKHCSQSCLTVFSLWKSVSDISHKCWQQIDYSKAGSSL